MRLIVIIFIIVSSLAYGQKVTKATSQRWAGGVCCRSGVSYVVTLSLEKPTKNVELYSVYLRGYGWIKGGMYSPAGDDQHFQVSFGTYRDDSEIIDTYRIQPIKVEKKEEADLVFNGEALIVLKVNGKDVKIEVDRFEALPHLAYP